MGKKLSTALLVVGAVLVVAAVVWWVVIAPMLVKLPDDVNTHMDFEGTLTVWADPETGTILPEDQGMEVPITAARDFVSLTDLYTSGQAVFEDTLVLTMMGEAATPQVSRYAMDRGSRKCVESTENWAYSPQLTLDRTGNYGPLFPGGLGVGDEVDVFFNDPSKVFTVKVAEAIEDWNGLGITALKIDATRETAPYNPAIQQAVLIQGQGLPSELAFDAFAAQLQAKGLDLGGLLAGVSTVASAEDLQALQALTQQPIALAYAQNSSDVYYIEQKTGATVGATFDRTTTMAPDTSGLLGAFEILGRYATDPTVGPAVAAALQAATQLQGAEPTKIFNQNMTIVSASEETLAQSAKDKVPLLALVDLWIPLIIVVLGALILVAGIVGLVVKPGKAA